MTIKLLILIIDHQSQFWERACCGRDLDLGRINLLRLLLLALVVEVRVLWPLVQLTLYVDALTVTASGNDGEADGTRDRACSRSGPLPIVTS